MGSRLYKDLMENLHALIENGDLNLEKLEPQEQETKRFTLDDIVLGASNEE